MKIRMIKVNRTQTPPESLAKEKIKKSGSYSCPDVIELLRHDFNDKCYLCECKYLTDPEVEHLLPHQNGKDINRKFDWNNLFWSCRHCNSVKNQKKYSENVIDCCNVDPKLYLEHRYVNGKVKITNKSNYAFSINTAELIEECFEKRNTGIRVAACDARITQLQMVLNELFDCLIEYQDSNSNYTKNKIISMLNNSGAYASFIQQYIRDNIEAYSFLKDFV